MNIGRRMTMGFGFLMIIATIIGIVGLLQVNTLSSSITDITNHEMVVADNTMEAITDMENMMLLYHKYVIGEVEGKEAEFDIAYNEFNEHLSNVATLMPEEQSLIIEMEDYAEVIYDAITNSTGSFNTLDLINETLHHIVDEHETQETNITLLITYQDSMYPRANATMLKAELMEQVFIVQDYLRSDSNAERTTLRADFSTHEAAFEDLITYLLANGNATE
ncbi:MAG: MCP four helix bundle domain-containing protein, partial [Promethearchaeota archaeon]